MKKQNILSLYRKRPFENSILFTEGALWLLSFTPLYFLLLLSNSFRANEKESGQLSRGDNNPHPGPFSTSEGVRERTPQMLPIPPSSEGSPRSSCAPKSRPRQPASICSAPLPGWRPHSSRAASWTPTKWPCSVNQKSQGGNWEGSAMPSKALWGHQRRARASVRTLTGPRLCAAFFWGVAPGRGWPVVHVLH